MTELEMQQALGDFFTQAAEDDMEGLFDELVDCEATSFADAEIMTDNKGLVVRCKDGSEFQVTIVKST